MSLLRFSPIAIVLFIMVAITHSAYGFDAMPLEAGYPEQAVTLFKTDDISIEAGFELPDFQTEQLSIGRDQFDKFTIEGESAAGPAGWPELPSVTRYYLVPPRSGIGLEIDNLETRIVRGVNPNFRQPMSESDAVSFIGPSEETELLVAEECLEYNGYWPPEVAELGNPVIMRGFRIVPVIIHPLRWNPGTSEMEIVESMEFKLDFTSDENMTNLVENPNRPRPSQSVDRIVSRLVENPPAPRRDDNIRGGSLIYITPDRDDVEEALEPLVEWRRRMGWTVEVVGVNNAGTTARVKEAIQEAYDEWEIPPEHIILVGDANGGHNYIIGYYNEGGNYHAYPYETDHHYGCLEGDDIIQEATVGRFCYNSINMLNGYVNKTIQYESEPYLGEDDDERGWQKRGMVCSISAESGWSSIDMCRWSKHLFRTHGYTDVAELYFTNLNPTEDQWIPREIANGVSFFVFRGHLHMGRYNGGRFTAILNLRNSGMLPFVMISTCNTGDYAESVSGDFYHSEYFVINPQGGAIGACGISGSSHTTYNNLITCSTVQAPFVGIPSQGWALVNGKIDLYRNYANRDDIDHHRTGFENWLSHTHLFNLIGDPAVDLYTDIPQELEVEHVNSIRAGDTRFDVEVALSGDNPLPAEGVLVCLYQAEEFQLTALTDADGQVSFVLNPDWTEVDDEIHLTITGHNLMPYLEAFEVVEAEIFLGAGSFEIDDDDNDASDGDGDGTANPGEIIELSLGIVNYGNEVPDDGLTAILTPALPNLSVSGDADSVHFDNAPNADESVTANFIVEIGGGFPQEADALFDLNVSSGDESFKSTVSIPVEGPQFDLVSYSWVDEPVATGSSADLTVSVKNIGERNSSPLDVSLACLTESAEVAADMRQIEDGVQVNEEGEPNGNFSVSARVYHLGNQRIDLALILDGENGFQDSVFFPVYSAESDSSQPFGPDNYGYLCVDNIDSNWFEFPEYEWIEIDPSEDGNGTDTELEDIRREDDESVVVDLPFDFQYYGETFDEVTICTNGWMAFGSYRDLATAVNRRIPSGLVAPAMLCPFWDDLVTRDESGIYYWHDEENHLFVVEWSNMHRLQSGDSVGDEDQTFQVILHDPEHYPSFTGDAHIHFQYLEVTDGRSCDHLFDTPYATVGIGSPKTDDGLEYVYWNDYNPGAAELESGRCIRFTTMITFDTGFAEGYVTDAKTDLPLADVNIVAFPGYSTVTNDTGYYFIDEVIADSLHLYKFTASKWGWNDSTLTDIEIVPEETTRVDLALLHPEFTFETHDIWFGLNPDSSCERKIDLTNGGNGSMWFTSRFNYIIEEGNDRDEPDEPWEQFLLWNVTEVTEDNRITGINFINGQWWIGGNDDGHDPNNYFYRFDRYGEFIDSLTIRQPINDRLGFNEFEYYNGYIYGFSTNVDDYMLKLDAESGEFVDSILVGNDRIIGLRVITINPTNGNIWASSTSNELYEFEIVDDTLIVVNEFDRPLDPRDDNYIRRYGLAWYKDDPDEYNLYLLSNKDIDDNPDIPDVSIYKMNVETGDVMFETNLPHLDGYYEGKGGMCITPKWNNMVWVAAVVFDHSEGDQVGVYELGPNASWINYEPRSDTLVAGEDIDITLLIDATDLDTGKYGVNIEFYHNALAHIDTMKITLDVSYSAISDDASNQPLEFRLDQNWPNPFNAATSISYSIEELSDVKLSIYDISGRLVSTLIDDKQQSGFYRLTFNAADMPNGLYFYRLEAQGKIATRKMILMK